MSISEKGVCSICDEIFDDVDLIEEGELFLCGKDLKTYQENSWIPHKQTIVSHANMQDALLLQELKDSLKDQKQPSYILASYKENKEGEIQTISTLYIKKTRD